MNQVPSTFADPWVLSLLLAMPLLSLAQLLAAWRSRRLLMRLGRPIAMIGLLPRPQRFRWLSAFLLSTAMTALVAGAAGPRWGRDPKPEMVGGRDVVILLDMSNSMRATDAPPDRFTRSVSAVRELVEHARSRGGHRLALVVLAADAQIVCPLTHDYNHVLERLGSLDLDRPPLGLQAKSDAKSGTRIGAGLQKALAAHDAAMKGFQDTILLSDGDDPVNDGEWEAGLKAVQSTEVPFHVVGIGDPNKDSFVAITGLETKARTRLHEGPLREIARRTGGLYLDARIESPPLADFFRRRIELKGTTMPHAEPPPLTQSRHVWFYATALLLFGLAGLLQLRRDDVKRLRIWKRVRKSSPQMEKPNVVRVLARVAVAALVLLTLSAPSPIAPEDWERRGQEAFIDGRFDEAIRYYQHAEELTGEPSRVAFNAGVAHFNLGRYREAERYFRACVESSSGDRKGRALYNLGTCLLHASESQDATRLTEAIDCFARCLEEKGIGETLTIDARHNFELAKQIWRKINTDAPPPDRDRKGNDENANQEDPNRGTGNDPGSENGGTGQGAGVRQVPAANGDGSKPTPVESNPQAGAGKMSPLTDNEQMRPLPPHEARKLVQEAIERIAREKRNALNGGGTAKSYPDW